jgi:phosphodiesterase/alkaline phosphatase D-like protein
MLNNSIAMPFVAGNGFDAPATTGLYMIDPSKVTIVAPPPPVIKPVQVHLALGHTPATMAVAWATSESTSAPITESIVMWGLAANKLDQTGTGDTRSFTVDSGRLWYTHAANMTDLKPSTRYFYKVCE